MKNNEGTWRHMLRRNTSRWILNWACKMFWIWQAWPKALATVVRMSRWDEFSRILPKVPEQPEPVWTYGSVYSSSDVFAWIARNRLKSRYVPFARMKVLYIIVFGVFLHNNGLWMFIGGPFSNNHNISHIVRITLRTISNIHFLWCWSEGFLKK